MCIEASRNIPIFETLEPRLLLSSTFDLDGDAIIAAGDDAIFTPAWQARGGYAFSDSLLQPGDTPGWDARCDFDGDFHVGSGDYAWLSTNWGLSEMDAIAFPHDLHDDDQYTDDAFDKGAFVEDTWFSEQYGAMAIAGDEDWFYIDVPVGRTLVSADLRFEHDEGNLDIRLYAIGGPVAWGSSTSDNETLQFALSSPGEHYLRVSSPEVHTGQRYDLKWTAEAIPDDHEPDDSVAESDAIGAFPAGVWYSEVYGYKSVQADVDYFAMDVPTGSTYLTFDATFSHAEGDINMYLWSEDYVQILDMGYSSTDNEHIELNLADFGYGPGRYYAWIFGPDNEQLYDFQWTVTALDFQAVDDTVTILEDSVNNLVDVLDNDTGADLEIVPTAGTTTDGEYVYITPYPNVNGQILFSYTIKQTGGTVTDSGLITANVTPVPDAPVAVDDTAWMPEDTIGATLNVLINDYDNDNDPIDITGAVITSATPIGSVSYDAEAVYYTPNAQVSGIETIEYTIEDPAGLTDTAVLTVSVGSTPDDPTAEDDFFAFVTGMHKNTLNVTANDYDDDGDPFSIIGFPVLPTDGDVTTDGLIVEYEPDEGFVGFDSFQYTIEDSTGRTDTATVDVQVLPTSDIHEEDDTRAQADALGVSPKMVAPSHLLDEDFYMIEILPGFDDRMTAELWCGPDMDMELLNADGVLVAESVPGPGHDKLLDTTAVSPGKYYVRVFSTGIYWGSGYVFLWDSFGPADPHEPDNTYAGADALGPLDAGVIVGGISNDGDCYRIEVPAGEGYVTAECSYDASAGNLDLELYDDHGLVVEGSYDDWSYRDTIERVVAPGVYYLHVFSPGGYSGQEYELVWYRMSTKDPHEDDNTLAQADARGYFREGYGFFDRYGRPATQTDSDLYHIDVRPGYLDIDVDCSFTDGEGDIDLLVANASGATVASSTTWTNDEHIDYLAPAPGVYYIRVFTTGSMSGLQTYDLVWHANKSDDTHEEDDYRLRSNEKGPFAANTWHDGTSWDPDVYVIEVPVGHLQFDVDCRFTHAEGNINVHVRDENLLSLPGGVGESTTDNEFLTVTPPGAGTYYIYVEAASGYTGQNYDLLWTPIASEDAHEEDDSRTQADARGPYAQNQTFTGQQWDDDIFRLEVAQGYEHVKVNCTFDSAEGDVDILLVDEFGFPVTASTGLGDGEHIDTVLGDYGTYYVYIYNGSGGSGTGQQYDFRWSAVQVDDSHENDNSFVLADLKGDFNDGYWRAGRAWDEDYYRLNVTGGPRRMIVDCQFTHADGNITLVLFDEGRNVIDIANSISDDERIDRIVDPGVYYVKVQTVNPVPGQQYDLRWDALADDEHENDDTLSQANAKGNLPAGGMTTAIQSDDDLYRISVPAGQETLDVRCYFSDAEGDVDLKLLNAAGTCIAYSTSADDNESMFFSVPSSGTYYILVETHGTPTGQVYDLTWGHNPGPDYLWNVMVYIAGDNNLSRYVQPDINEMAAAGLPASVAVTVLADDASDETDIFLLGGPGTTYDDLDTGDPDVLSSFIDWSLTAYPAYNTALVLWDHGGGLSGACSDDESGNGLSLAEISAVFDEFPTFDVIGFDACVMGLFDVTYQFRDNCDYLVASEANIPGTGWDYNRWLDGLAADPNMSPRTLAEEAVEAYGQTYGGANTLSAISMDVVPAVAENLDDFADAVLADADIEDWAIIQNAKRSATHFGDYRDFGDFMYIIETAAGVTPSIATAAYTARRQLQQIVIANYDGPSTSTTGQTLYLPMSSSLNGWCWPTEVEFVADTNWREFLLGVEAVDDPHERDDSFSQARNQGNIMESFPLDGIMLNDDYYAFYAGDPGELNVTFNCYFTDSEGNIDIVLYDDDENVLDDSHSHTDNEFITYTLPSTGRYYILVKTDGALSGQDYSVSYHLSAPGAPPAGAPAFAAASTDVLDVEYAILAAPSAGDTAASLPTSLTDVQIDDTFFVELWMKNQPAGGNGIVGGYVDMWFDNLILDARAVSSGGAYTNFAQAEIGEFGSSVQLGGLADYGVIDLGDDEWVRLGYIEFTAVGEGTNWFMTGGGMDKFARASEGAVEWMDVEMDVPMAELTVETGPPSVSVNLQAASDTGVSDSDNITYDNTPAYDVTVNMEGAIYVYYDGDGAPDNTLYAPAAGTYTFTPTVPLADGDFIDYPVQVELVVDGLGSATASDPTTIDTQAPVVTVNALTTTDSRPMLTGTVDDHDAALQVTVDAHLYAAANNGDGTWTLVDNAITPALADGDYDVAAGATDPSGNVGADATTDELTVTPPYVTGRHVFYNNSAWDGNDPSPNISDDGAIATGEQKQVLLPGQIVSFRNYTSYWRGINGIMVDIDDISSMPTTADFGIRVNEAADPNLWSTGPTPTVSIRPGEGVGGSDRVTLIWADGAILNQWVEVTVLATPNTGLAVDDVFYLGNAVGDCDGDGEVGSSDYGTFAGEFGLSGGIGAMVADFNADGWTDLSDFAIMRGAIDNSVSTPTIPPAPAAPPAPVTGGEAGLDVLAVPAAVTSVNPETMDPETAIVPAPSVDLLVMPSLTNHISGTPAISGGLSATRLYRAATSAYDLRPLGDDPLALSESNGASDAPGDDLLADILAESALAVRL